MKFAKTLQEELRPDWCAQYVNYKLLKKILKREQNEQAVETFCSVLQAEVKKVSAFMQALPESLLEAVPIQCRVDLARPSSAVSIDGCEAMVDDVQSFQSYAALNHTAVRKIIKKFDKRFQFSFHEQIGLPDTSKRLFNAADIGNLLLVPAQHCLRLLRSVAGGRKPGGTIERPLKQFNFWAEELRAGVRLAKTQISGDRFKHITDMRLQIMCGRKDLKCCIRNTFIDFVDLPEAQAHMRANSVPPRARVDSDIADQTISDDLTTFSLKHALCDTTSVAPPPQELAIEMDVDDAAGDFQIERVDLPRVGNDALLNVQTTSCFHAITDVRPDTTKATAIGRGAGNGFAANWALTVPSSQAEMNSMDPSAASSEEARCPMSSKRDGCRQALAKGRGRGQGKGGGKGGSDSSRWWADTQAVCALSGFPISLLPYPPFKLYAPSTDSQEPIKLVDGPFMVFKVLSTLDFEVLGRQLTESDISALDMYMKRCKLGPFRLGRALELLSLGTREAAKELELLRTRAKRRLDGLRHIQRVRLCRGDWHTPISKEKGEQLMQPKPVACQNRGPEPPGRRL
eukprot:TRINITY_DN35518_c0_g1_i1.p1 TRINITY_DN35518_c0_g1~~TRINITY_DN35518_c0_g1_i1.p1  ORF type:complete len:571 (-),score=109.98 TRINITY_DN35518_c0_g1_i1:15-1727(-)